jgi:hypothetical protein
LYSSGTPSSPSSQSQKSFTAEPEYELEYTDAKGPVLDVSTSHSRASFHQFPPGCVDPSVITKFEPPPDDVLFLSPPETVTSEALYFTGEFSNCQESDSSPGSGSWSSDSKTSVVLDAGGFDVAHPAFVEEGDAYGLNTYDSLEFQTLREHNLLTSSSDHYLQ